MIDGFLLVVAAAKIINELSAKSKIRDVVKRNGLDHEEWDKFRQEQIFDKYLWNVDACPEQEYLTTWELYQMAQKELREDGYIWNPAWDRYTPTPDSCEYVRGTQIYHKLLDSEFHRYGEDVDIQLDLFRRRLIGDTKDETPYHNSRGRKTDGSTQYEDYLLLKTIYTNPGIQLPLGKSLDSEDRFYNKYGEPFRWYDDLMPFVPSKTFILYPSEKTYEEYKAKGIDLNMMQRDMETSFYRNETHIRTVVKHRNMNLSDLKNRKR